MQFLTSLGPNDLSQALFRNPLPILHPFPSQGPALPTHAAGPPLNGEMRHQSPPLATGHIPPWGHTVGRTPHSPFRCSLDGITLHFLKNSSVSLSTTSSLVSSPPALMAATTSPCCLPSMQTPFTCGGGGRHRSHF